MSEKTMDKYGNNLHQQYTGVLLLNKGTMDKRTDN